VPCGSVCETKVLEECAAAMFRLENGGSRFFFKMLVSLCFYHTIHYDCQDFHNHESFTCLKFFLRVIVLGIVTLLQFGIWIQECTLESRTESFKSHFTLLV